MANTRSFLTRWWLWLLVVAAAGIWAVWLAYGEGLTKTGAAGTAYGARVACSCRFVAGRDLDDCARDKLEGMEMISFSADEANRSVTASIPFVASDTATYREGYGCLLKPWED